MNPITSSDLPRWQGDFRVETVAYLQFTLLRAKISAQKGL